MAEAETQALTRTDLSLGQGSANNGLLPVFVDGLLWEHSRAHSLVRCLWLLWGYSGRAESSVTLTVCPQGRKWYFLAFYGRSLLIPDGDKYISKQWLEQSREQTGDPSGGQIAAC